MARSYPGWLLDGRAFGGEHLLAEGVREHMRRRNRTGINTEPAKVEQRSAYITQYAASRFF
jgi:hypothetical protein